MPDWTERLTEEERAALEYTRTVGASAGAAHTVEVLHVCHESLAAFRTVATLRALVEEIAQVRDWVREQRQKTDDIKDDSLFHGIWEEVEERLDAALAEAEMKERFGDASGVD